MTKIIIKILRSYLSDIKFVTEDFSKRVLYVLCGHISCCYLVVVVDALIKEHFALVRRYNLISGRYSLVICRMVKGYIYPPPYGFITSELVCSLCGSCGFYLKYDSVGFRLSAVVLLVISLSVHSQTIRLNCFP